MFMDPVDTFSVPIGLMSWVKQRAGGSSTSITFLVETDKTCQDAVSWEQVIPIFRPTRGLRKNKSSMGPARCPSFGPLGTQPPTTMRNFTKPSKGSNQCLIHQTGGKEEKIYIEQLGRKNCVNFQSPKVISLYMCINNIQ